MATTCMARLCTTAATGRSVLINSRLKQNVLPMWRLYPVAQYAKKTSRGSAGPESKALMEVNENPEDLLRYCCGANYLKEGPELELNTDNNAYPDWLWELHIGPPPKLEELDPESTQYWRRIRKAEIRRINRLAKYKPK